MSPQLALLSSEAAPVAFHPAARTYGHLRFDPATKHWCFVDLEPQVVIRLKDVFKRIDKAASGVIRLADGPDTCTDIEWFLQRYPLALDQGVSARLADGRAAYERGRRTIEEILLPDWQPPAYAGWQGGIAPYPYQGQAIEVARRLRRLLLMDDVGLGKTLTALGVLLADPDSLPAAIVVEAHLAEQWAEDQILPYTTLRPHVIKGTVPYTLPPADVYIFKYSNVAGWADIAARGVFRSVIFDEVQQLRTGPHTQKGKGAKAFRDHAGLRMGLSATPVYNYGDDIFRVLEFIEPGAMGSWEEFVREWCKPIGVGKYAVKDPTALGAYLRDLQLVLRRTEDDVGRQLPPLNTISHEVPFDAAVAEAAEEQARLLAIKVTTGEFHERGRAARDLDVLARHTTGVAKARHVAAFVRVLVEQGVPVLLAGWHRDVYDIWLEDLKPFRPLLYTGSETSKQKRATKQAFLAGETDLVIISLRSGTGLDGLQQRGSTVVFGELDWSPQIHRQVIGRLRRPGQTRQVDAIYLHTNSGSDPPMIETLGVKASQARGIVDPFKGVETVTSDQSRIIRLAEQYLAGRRP